MKYGYNIYLQYLTLIFLNISSNLFTSYLYYPYNANRFNAYSFLHNTYITNVI